jgi:hypothetical protein
MRPEEPLADKSQARLSGFSCNEPCPSGRASTIGSAFAPNGQASSVASARR